MPTGLDTSSLPDVIDSLQSLVSGGAGSNTISSLLSSVGQSLSKRLLII